MKNPVLGYKEILNKKNKYNFIKEKRIYFNDFIYFFPYKNIIRKLMLQYKFNNQAYISNLFATFILKQENCCRKIKHYDIIIPVPMFEKKKRQRGYNQAELIAEKIAKNLNIVIENKCIIKIKNTKVQSTLSAEKRKENIKDAFCVKDIEKIKGKNIIIFDDIFTTGETVNEISRILKKVGANNILIVVIAKD